MTPVIALGLAIVAGVWGTANLSNDPAGPYGGYLNLYNPQPVLDAPTAPNGAALYAHHCAHCHGVNGDGNGITPLSPKARYFAFEKFKFTDTLNPTKSGGGTPTDDNLLAILKRGIPGSPMPSFDHLGEDNLRAIVDYVRTQFIRPHVVLQRIKKKLIQDVEDVGEEWIEKSDWSDAKQARYRAVAIAEVEVGNPLELPDAFPNPTPESVERGRQAFAKLGCVSCHGPKGEGDGQQSLDPKFVNENGTRAYPRDLTAGVYKGGGHEADLFRRVYLGIPGTPMPANGVTASKQDLIDVVLYVKSLADSSQAQLQKEVDQKVVAK